MRGKIALCALFICARAWAQTGGLEQAWKEADEAREKGAFKQASAYLESIERAAVSQRLWGQAVKAVAARAECAATLRGGGPGSAISLLHDAVERAPEPMRPMLAVLLANRYWRCFAEGNAQPGAPISVVDGQSGKKEAWTLPQLQAEVEHQFRRALAYAAELKTVPVSDYGDLLEAGTAPDVCRPTLYDFLVNEMIAFYALGADDGVTWNDGTELSAEGPAFSSDADFMFVIPEDAAKRSHVLRALRLFQELLSFHAADKDLAAYADADLNRLVFCRRHVSGEQADERYAAALDRFINTWKRLEIMSRAAALRARLALNEGKPGLAHVIAQNGAAAYPASVGAAQCRNLVAEVERPRLSFHAERVWCKPWPELTVTYTNLREVFFRAVPIAFEETLSDDGAPVFRNAEKASALLSRKAVKEWSLPLQPAADYLPHTFCQPVPKNLPPGLYAVFASSDGTFSGHGAPLFGEVFCVSSLALAVRQSGGRVQGIVLSANEGEPVAGARVELWRRDRPGRFRREQTILTEDDGIFTFSGGQPGDVWVRALSNGESAQIWQPVWIDNERERVHGPEARVAFFTDRDRYRPGEPIRYKGVYYVVGDRSVGGQTVDGRVLAIRLRDDGGRTLDEQKVESNAFGSFSGSFMVPTNGVSGRLILGAVGLDETAVVVSDGSPAGFDVSLAPSEGGAKLGTVVTVEGRAATLGGRPMAGSRVAWCVGRESGAPDGPDREITRGNATCDRDGRFEMSFFARPDPHAPVREDARYVFRVTARVCDASGNTREGVCRLALDDSMWRADIGCDAWQTAGRLVPLTVRVTMCGGEGVEGVAGTLQVLNVRQPDGVRRSACDGQGHAASRGGSVEERKGSEGWADGEEVSSGSVATGPDGVARYSAALPAGLFRVRFSTRDRSGRLVSAQRLVRVIDPEASRFVAKEPDYFEAEAWCLEPGETFRAVWGSGYDSARAVIVVEQSGHERIRLVTKRGVTQQQIVFPVTEAMRGGVQVSVFCVRGNRVYAHECFLDVPWSNKRLSVDWERSSALVAGKNVTWRATVRDHQGNPAAAELLALVRARPDLSGTGNACWSGAFDACWPDGGSESSILFSNGDVSMQAWCGEWAGTVEPDAWRYRSWCGSFRAPSVGKRSPAATQSAASGEGDGGATATGDGPRDVGAGLVAVEPPVFFYPHIVTGSDGQADLTFTVPEGAGLWHLESFAHDKGLRCGFAEWDGETVGP